MAIQPGTKFGPYEILSAAGAGGMGEVYRARDTRLDRTVAIKVLPEQFSQHAELKQRLEREARAISSLNHPHICHLYDIGQQSGIDYLVMEFVEGESLAQRLAKGALPLDDVLKIGAEIADALAKAHRQGIVHRDLKPGNIMLTRSGAKLLDFGLAKPAGAMKVASSLSAVAVAETSPATPITQHGTLIGTFQYMSPEQVEGKEADVRSDIFALGAVLYEMATGKRAFDGKSAISVASAILEREPEPISHIQPLTPPVLEHVVRTCLAKDPEERWQSAADVVRELRWISHTGKQATAHGRPRASRTKSLVFATAVLLAIGIGALVGRWTETAPGTNLPPAAFDIPWPTGTQVLSLGLAPTVAISPDGTHVAYVLADLNSSKLYVRSMGEVESKTIDGTDGADGIFFSPDGRWIGFFADHKLKKVSVDGGAPVTLCDSGTTLGAVWGGDDQIIFAPVAGAGFSRVAASGGTPQSVLSPDFTKHEADFEWPGFLPDGETVLFTDFETTGKSRIESWNTRTGARHTILTDGMNARYSAGYLVFTRGDTLLAAPFDAKHATVIGEPVPVLEGVAPTLIGGGQFDLARDGTLAYVAGGSPAINRALVWVDHTGRAQPIAAPMRAYLDPRLSPDGKRIVVEVFSGTGGDLWTYDFDRGTLARVTFGGFENETPAWMPDGRRVAFSSSREGVKRAVYLKDVTGSAPEELIATTDQHVHLTGASSDGRYLLYTKYDPVTQGDIWLLPLTGDRKPQPLVQTRFHEWGGVFSPDTHWFAYVSNESGRDEIYVQSFPGLAEKYQISSEGGKEPVWSRDGKQLFYRDGRKFMAVSITTSPRFTAGKPQMLFENFYASGLTLGHTDYDVSPDGQRFLMIQAHPEGSATERLIVRQDWIGQIRGQAPAAK